MKSESEVRDRLEAMTFLHAQPCSCAEEGHEGECRIGGMMMLAQIRVLKWMIGECPEEDALVKGMMERLIDLQVMPGSSRVDCALAQSVKALSPATALDAGLDLAAIEQRVRTHGPTRVLVGPFGAAVSSLRAVRCGHRYDAVLVRKDGWTLGFPACLKDEALRLWSGSWVHCFPIHS